MFETTTSMMIVGLQCKEILQVEQGYTNVEVNDATPITQENASNSDNASTMGTGITNTEDAGSVESGLYKILKKNRGSSVPDGDGGGGGGY